MSIEALLDVERERARLHARQAELLVEVASTQRTVDEFGLLSPDDDRERTVRIEDSVRDEIASALRRSPALAQCRIDDARLLVGFLPEALAALRSADITAHHGRVITEAANRLPGR